jgi:hypothetical protein
LKERDMSFTKVGSLGYGGQQLNHDLPQILIELQGLTVSGPLAGVGASAALAVADNGGIDIQDTLLKVLLFNPGSISQSGTTPFAVTAVAPSWTDITATTSIVDLRATGTLTVGAVAAADAVSVNGRVYTFAALSVNNSTNVAPGVVPIGTTTTITAANLAKAINSQDDSLVCTSSANVVTVKAYAEGVAGNSIALSVAASNAHVAKSGALLTGGSATNAVLSTTATTGGQVFVTWFKKDRLVTQP